MILIILAISLWPQLRHLQAFFFFKITRVANNQNTPNYHLLPPLPTHQYYGEHCSAANDLSYLVMPCQLASLPFLAHERPNKVQVQKVKESSAKSENCQFLPGVGRPLPPQLTFENLYLAVRASRHTIYELKKKIRRYP